MNVVLLTLISAMTLAVSGCGDDAVGEPGLTEREKSAARPEGTGKARCHGVAIAYVGTINDDKGAAGRNIHDGVEYAVHRHNVANPGCQVELAEYNTEGILAKVPGILAGLVARKDVVGVVGLPFSDESQLAGPVLAKRGLVQITPTAADARLSRNGWGTFFRGTASETVQAAAAAKFLTSGLPKRKVCVLDDGSRDGRGLAGAFQRKLGVRATCGESVTAAAAIGDAAAKVARQKPDAVYYAGKRGPAVRLAKALAREGVRVPFVASGAVMGAGYVRAAGRAAGTTYFVCSCAPQDRFRGFTAGFRAVTGRGPGPYALEGYDAATVLLNGIDAGQRSRKALRGYVAKRNADGLSNRFKWTGTGELARPAMWIYQVRDGAIVLHSEIK